MVGSAQISSGVWHAVLWTHKNFKAVDLNTEISEKVAQEVTLTDAVGTNDKCTIVANGYNNKTGAQACAVPGRPGKLQRTMSGAAGEAIITKAS